MEWCACTWCSWWSELHHSSATWWSWHWCFDTPSCLIIWTCRTVTWCLWWWFSCWRSSSRCQSGFGFGLWLQCIHGFYTKSTICLCVSTCGTNDIWTCRLVFAQFNDCFPCTYCWSSSWPSCHCASFTMSTTRSTTACGCSDPSTCARHPACLYWMPCRDRFGTSCPSLSWRSSCCSAQYKTGPSCVSSLATDQHSSTDTCGCLLRMGPQSLFGLSQWSWMAHPGACPSLHPAWRLFQSDCPTSTRWPWWYCPCCTCCAWSGGSLWFSNGQSSHSWPATGWQSGPCTCTSCCTSGWCSCTYLQERWRSGVWWLSCVGSISTTYCSSSPWRWLDQRLDVPASTTFSCAWHGRGSWRSCLPLLTDMVHSSWPTSVVPRPVRLTNEAIGWSLDLRQTWIDLLDPHIAVTIHLVQPTPPQSPLQSYSAHLILEQARPPGRSAVVVSALFESLQGNALMQVAKSMPRHVTAHDVIQESELVPHCSVRPCSVWIGPRQVNVVVATAVESGTGMRIHLRPMPYEPSQLAQPPYPADGMHAEPSLLTTPLMRADGTHFIEDEPPDNTIAFLQRRVLTLQRNLRTFLAVSSGAAIQPSVVEGPVDGPAEKHPLQLESLIPHHSTVIKAPCHKVAFLANHLLTIDIDAIQPFASVVKWHDQTLLARASCPDWNYEAPLRIWFYTDGASSMKADSQQRCASASAVLLVETVAGLKFGGFRTCTVPAPATAPFAEHVALQLASLWCIQLHEWCRWAFGLNGIQTTFVFDCLAAGHAAHGSWCCTQHAALHHRTRALQHWIESRYFCTPAFIHVHSHRGDPWNEAADAICWATLHDWIPGVSFDELCHQQLVPFDDVVPWLWYWQRSLQGAVGYPDVRDGFFNFSFQHVDAPLLDSSTHSFCQVQQDDSAASQQTATLTLRAATANVLTLYSNQAAHGRYISARHEALMHEFHCHGAHLVGVQETRSRLTGHHAAEHYHVIAVPALANGHGGLQLWIAKVIEVGSTQLLVRDSHLRVLQQSERHLIVRISVDGLKLLAIVGHVPCMPDVSAATAWWQKLLQGLPTAYQHWPRIMMVDANARVGSLPSAAIGPHQASTENEHGEMMHQWMIDNGMFAPQTFDCHHIGSASTFAHAKGPEGRIDFVLVDEALRHPSIQSFVTDIDLATQRPDHFAVAVDIPITLWHRSRRIRRQPDVAAANTAGTSPPQIPWDLDVHSHAALLHQWLRGWQPKRPHLPRKKHLTPDTWHLVQTKAFHWKRSRQIRATLRTTTLRAIFDAWRTCDAPQANNDTSSQWLKISQMDLAWHLDQHRRMDAIVADAVRRDDTAFFESFARRHNDEALPTLWKTLKPLLPRAAARRRNNLRCIGPATHDIVQHFDALEAGEPALYPDLLQQCHESQQRALDEAPLVVALTDLPNRVDLEQLCCRGKRGRAPGLDLVTTETLRECLLPASDTFHVLVMKAFLQGSEPLQWKGGRMHVIPKKSNMMRADAMRGIMVLTSCGKLYHALLRRMLLDWTTSMRLPAQMGGFCGQHTSFATHLLRTYCNLITQAKMSYGVLFFDVRAAFHSMLREHAFGGTGLPTRLCSVLDAAGLNVQQLCRDIQVHCQRFEEHPNPCLQRAVRDAHCFTWYMVQGDPECHRTHRGSRPGSPLADIAYNITMMNVLRDILPLLHEQVSLCAATAQLPIFSPLVTRVDDLAIPVPAIRAQDLDAQIVAVLTCVKQVMASYGLQLNMQAGKTELVCQYHGANAVACRHQRFIERAGRLELPDGSLLHVVGQYQHLGTAFSQSLSLKAELDGRIGKAAAAFRQLSRAVFNNKRLNPKVRLQLLESLVLSIVFYGSGTWPLLNHRQYTKLAHVIVKWQRQITLDGFWQDNPTPDADLQAKWQLPVLSARLAKHRLLYAFQMAANAPQDLVTCLTAEDALPNGSPWCVALRHAISWMRLHDPDGIATADVGSPESLIQWLHDHRADGPPLVRRLAQRALQQDFVMFEFKQKTRQIVEACRSHGVQFDQTPEIPLIAHHVDFSCHVCGQGFSSVQGLQAHLWRKHHLLSEERKYVYDTTCRACNRCFWTAQRLQQHLRWSRRHPDGCFAVLKRYFQPLSAPEACETPAFVKGISRLPACTVEGPMPDVMDTVWSQQQAECRRALTAEWTRLGFPDALDANVKEQVFAQCSSTTLHWIRDTPLDELSIDHLMHVWLVSLTEAENSDSSDLLMNAMTWAFLLWGQTILSDIIEQTEDLQITRSVWIKHSMRCRNFSICLTCWLSLTGLIAPGNLLPWSPLPQSAWLTLEVQPPWNHFPRPTLSSRGSWSSSYRQWLTGLVHKQFPLSLALLRSRLYLSSTCSQDVDANLTVTTGLRPSLPSCCPSSMWFLYPWTRSSMHSWETWWLAPVSVTQQLLLMLEYLVLDWPDHPAKHGLLPGICNVMLWVLMVLGLFVRVWMLGALLGSVHESCCNYVLARTWCCTACCWKSSSVWVEVAASWSILRSLMTKALHRYGEPCTIVALSCAPTWPRWSTLSSGGLELSRLNRLSYADWDCQSWLGTFIHAGFPAYQDPPKSFPDMTEQPNNFVPQLRRNTHRSFARD